METVVINGTSRENVGKKASKKVRNSELIPCVLYGGKDNIHFTANLKEVKDLVYTPAFKLATISIDGSDYRCILKDIQFHPVTDNILHLDFLQLQDGKYVKVELPVSFKGNSPGVKEGGILVQKLRRVNVKTKPEFLVDELLIDISDLGMAQSIRVRDIEIQEDMEVLNSPGIPVASVEVPRALKSAAADSEEGAEEVVEEGAEEAAATE